MLRHRNFFTGKLLENFNYVSPLTRIADDRILTSLINLYHKNGRLAKQAVLENIRIPA